MMPTSISLTTNEIPLYIAKLKEILGEDKLQQAMQKYERALKQQPELVRDYITKQTHPWFEALRLYDELRKQGKYHEFTPNIAQLASDAKMIEQLFPIMPKSVREKYRCDLVSFDTAGDYKFELDAAWNYRKHGYSLTWYDKNGTQPEFCVNTGNFIFDVECKRLNTDSITPIIRKDFYGIANEIIKKIEKISLCGEIELIFPDKIPTNQKTVKDFNKALIKIIKEDGVHSGEYDIQGVTVILKLSQRMNTPINMIQLRQSLNEQKAIDARVVATGYKQNGRMFDPITIYGKSRKQSDVLVKIRRIISKAGKQLSKTHPGIVWFHIPDVEEFVGLEQPGSGLSDVTHDLFQSEDRKHIAAILYSGETQMVADQSNIVMPNGEQFSKYQSKTNVLIFANPNCMYPAAKVFNFIDPGKPVSAP